MVNVQDVPSGNKQTAFKDRHLLSHTVPYVTPLMLPMKYTELNIDNFFYSSYYVRVTY